MPPAGRRSGYPARAPQSRQSWRSLWRITPARTGSTAAPPARHSPTQDHPRAYGEHSMYACNVASLIGSPPRVQGAPGHAAAHPAAHRITPARTGSTPPSPASRPGCADHPRAYGEHGGTPLPLIIDCGSPPRVRGARWSIPKRAPSSTDHPRAYGEHGGTITEIEADIGSPPRVRRALEALLHERSDLRITPARAGSTLRSAPRTPTTLDHPRACREHCSSVTGTSWPHGSSPRARGPQRSIPPVHHRVRITPGVYGGALVGP